ncbi:hypothetical protein [Deinococcus grandis]|nr:hypothetical protein [Deinococcus grandis]BBN97170.1 hypothetical protein DEGR_39030 [Deinococcus grandis]
MLHIAAKMRLQEALTLRARPFVLRRACQRHACDATHDEVWELPPYDEVRAEQRLGSFVLDVATIRDGAVSVGFEVFVSHRVDTVKAATLDVPWLELQADATAQDPYVLQPVVDSTFTAHEEDDLRRSLRATRAEVPDRLERWLASLPIVEGRSYVRVPPTRLQSKVFESRREGISFRPGWWCPQCAADRDTYRKAALKAEQERAALARERAEALAQAAEVHEREQQAYQAMQAARLAEQRPVFGAWLLKPFNTYALPIMTRNAPVLRTACQYLQRHCPDVAGRLHRWKGQTLIARRCWKCQRAILCLDSRLVVRDAEAFSPVAECDRGRDGRRGPLVNRCLACGERQSTSTLREGRFVVLRDDVLLSWIDAFGSLPRAATPPDRQT